MLSYHPEGYWSHCVRRENFRETMMLAPISEVPKVTFAGRYVKGEGNSYAAQDTVKVKFIPHVSEYSSADKHDIWYTNDEVKAMKNNAIRDIDVRKEEMKSKKNQYHNHQQDQQYTCDIRGLERLVYDDNNDCATRRNEARHAVFQEQYAQRCWMYSVNNPGGIINSDDDDLNHERIRQLCMAKGETIRSQEIALGLAKQDEAEANEYLQVVPEDEALDQQQQQQLEQYQETMIGNNNRNTGKISSSNGDCCWCADVVNVVGRSLLLRVLLKPLIDMRGGDSFFLE